METRGHRSICGRQRVLQSRLEKAVETALWKLNVLMVEILR